MQSTTDCEDYISPKINKELDKKAISTSDGNLSCPTLILTLVEISNSLKKLPSFRSEEPHYAVTRKRGIRSFAAISITTYTSDRRFLSDLVILQ